MNRLVQGSLGNRFIYCACNMIGGGGEDVYHREALPVRREALVKGMKRFPGHSNRSIAADI